jgi:drug/metabolite transporter (DMT)-like permease
MLGLSLALGALACEASFSLLAAPHLARLGPLAVSAYACLFALPPLALWGLLQGGPGPVAPSAAELAAIVYLGAAVTAGGFVCWYSAVGLLGVERAGLFSGVLPVSALACAALLGVAELSAARLVAVLVVVAGITLGVRARSPRNAGASHGASACQPVQTCSSTHSNGSATRPFASASAGRSST